MLSTKLVLLLATSLVTAGNIPRDKLVYQDATRPPAERAVDLLSRMTWEEKVGQLGGIRQPFQSVDGKPSFNRTAYDITHELQNGQIGYGPQANWAADVMPMMQDIRAEQVNDTRLHIPYIVIADSVNGILISGGTLFPGTCAVAASWNLPLYSDVVAAIRDENYAVGINWVLSPELDLAKDPRNGRNGEMYGEDGYLVGEFATRYVQAMQEKDEGGWVKVATTIKHFVYGSGSGGVNRASMQGGMNHILNDLAPPYRKVIRDAQALSLMASYSSVDGVPMSINTHMLQDVLRGTLGFEGLIMSDAFAIEHILLEAKVASSRANAAVLALGAGLELELHPRGDGLFTELAELGSDDSIVSLVDSAVLALLHIKFITGQFDRPLPTVEAMNKTLRSEHHLALNRNITRESIVMLKNDGLLPLARDSISKVAVVGPYSDIINAGTYSPSDPTDSRYGDSFRQSLEKKLGADNVIYSKGLSTILPTHGNETVDEQLIAEAVDAAKSAGLAVVVLGSGFGNFGKKIQEPNARTNGEGFAHADLGFPGRQQQLLDAVLDAGVPTVLVMSSGQTFVLNNATMERCGAIFHSWLGGEYTGDSLVEILFGETNPSGKLTVTIPQANGAFPVAYNLFPSDDVGGIGNAKLYDWQWPQLTRKAPLAFGFGLSYTSFELSGESAKVRRCGSNKTAAVSVSVDVANTGKMDGKEVVQVYFRPEYSVIEVPVMQLIRFAKVDVAAGASTKVTFPDITVDEMGYYIDSKWHVQGGNYTFWIGTSSRAEDLTRVNVTLPM